MLRFALVIGLAAAVSTAAFASPLLQAQGNTPEPADNPSTTGDTSRFDPGKVICRNVKPPTGTRLSGSRNRQRICMTQADWDQEAEEARAAARAAGNNGIYSAPNENAQPAG